jgi:predicted metal-dependent phosphoesterase TrpH
MLIKGALHIHTEFSHDGKLSLASVADLYRGRGFQFVCITEHSQDMDERKVMALRQQAESLSGPSFIIIPGIEYSCKDALHIVGIGCDRLLDTFDPVRLVRKIRGGGCFAILAHPRRIYWDCSPDLASNLNAVEVWNVRYDGKYLPSPQALEFFNRMKLMNPKLLAAVGDDFHALGGCYPLNCHMSVNSLDRESILNALIHGQYEIGSLSYRVPASSGFSPRALACFRALRLPLDCAKAVRDKMSKGKN